MSVEGAVLFARYAYPPNELGYCGPDGAAEMLQSAAVDEIERRARAFEGAWSYLEILATALGLDDPLAEDVVDAYWVGSDLLDAVDPAALVEHLTDRFLGQPGGTWRAATGRARAHHSFQVFEVYPWAGLLLEGRLSGPAVTVLDQCRIRVGVVQGVAGESVTVLSRPLAWDGSNLTPGDAAVETARWSVDGRSLIDAPAQGDLVALHWDWVCDVLTPDQASRVCGLESRQRQAVGLWSPAWTGAVADAGQVDDHDDVLDAAAGLAPQVLVDTEHGDAVEPDDIVDQDPLAFCEDGVVGGFHATPRPLGDAGDGEVLTPDGFQRLPQP